MKNTHLLHWAVVGSAGAVMLWSAAVARANSVYATYVSNDGLGNFTYQIQFTNTSTPPESIFANNGGLRFNSYPGFTGASISAVQYGSMGDWAMTTGLDWAEFRYTGSTTTTVSGTNLLTVVLSSTITTLSPLVNDPTVGYDYTNQGGVPGGAQTNTGNVQGPGVGAVTPLPAAAWAGLSLLGTMGAWGCMRRKVRA